MEGVDLFNGIVFPYINLLIFLILAFLLFRNPIKNALMARKVAYEELLQKAKAAKEEAEARNAELRQRLRSLDDEVNGIRLRAEAQALEEAKAIVTSAEQLALHLKAEAKRIAESEVLAAKQGLREEIIKQVKSETLVQLQAQLSETKQHQVIRSNMDKLTGLQTEVHS